MEIIREQGAAINEARREGKTATVSKASADATVPDLERILDAHDLANNDLLSKLITESFRLMKSGDEREGFRMLERALMLSPRNVALYFLAARKAFAADRYSDARRFLDRCHDLAPDDLQVLLLLGALCADEGDTDKARLYLSVHADNRRTALVVNLIWAMLAAYEGNYPESLAALKLAAERSESAELSYFAGCVCYELGELPSALRHLQKAVSLDRNFADAWFMQAEIYRRDEDVRESNMLAKAADAQDATAQCSQMLKKERIELKTALPFAHFATEGSRVINGGSRRIARLIRAEIEKAIEIENER